MTPLNALGKLLMVLGGLLLIIGAAVVLLDKLPWFGRLPGDIYVQRPDVTFFFPITTSILISVILSLVVYLLSRR
jgi:Protein of unknown function (DUF2905)